MRRTATIATAMALILTGTTACGGGGGDPTASTAPEPAPGGAERIVSLSPVATEMLYAIGAGDQVVAADDASDFPEEAPQTTLSGIEPNLEAIAAYRPDLVVTQDGGPTDLEDGLKRMGIRLVAQPAAERLDDAYAQLRELGRLTGHADEADAVADRMRARIERAFGGTPQGRPLTVFHELSPDLYTAASRTFVGRVYARMGVRNVADPAARRAGTQYPQLSPEAVVSADPDVVVLGDVDCCDQSAATVAARTGWRDVSAVRTGAVVEVPDAVANRWGPRFPAFVEHVARVVTRLRSGDGRAR